MSNYVQITRPDLEDWLNTLHLHKKWHLELGRTSIYLLPLSEVVAIKLSSTIGSQNDAMGKGEASMQLSLISTVTGQVINKKAQGQSHFARTINWRKTWAIGIERFREAYTKAQGFYEALAVIQNREDYKRDILKRIETFPNWEAHDILNDFHSRVFQNGILITKQTELLDKILSGKIKDFPIARLPVDDVLLNRLRALYVAARHQNDTWVMQFAESVGKQVKLGRPPSLKQQEILDRNFNIFKVATINLRSIVRKLIAVTK